LVDSAERIGDINSKVCHDIKQVGSCAGRSFLIDSQPVHGRSGYASRQLLLFPIYSQKLMVMTNARSADNYYSGCSSRI